jgi:hypothetical protein
MPELTFYGIQYHSVPTGERIMGIYANKSATTSLRAIFQKKSNGVGSIKIASAFFNYDEIVTELNSRGIKLDLIVRLSEATSPDALRKIHLLPNVQVRYYTSKSFHPKFYIFGDVSAIIGSANFTSSGFNSNSEMCIEVPSGSDDFDDLAYVFQEHWDEAKALTPEVLKDYTRIHDRFQQKGVGSLEQAILGELGQHAPSTEIAPNTKKRDKRTLFVDDYERTYQIFEKAFHEIEKIYNNTGKRKVPDSTLPLRIEIDQFLNFVRKEFTHGESYNDEPILPAHCLLVASPRSGEQTHVQVVTHGFAWLLVQRVHESAHLLHGQEPFPAVFLKSLHGIGRIGLVPAPFDGLVEHQAYQRMGMVCPHHATILPHPLMQFAYVLRCNPRQLLIRPRRKIKPVYGFVITAGGLAVQLGMSVKVQAPQFP